MDRKKITELIKWFMWIGSLIGVYTEGRVSKARIEEKNEVVLEQMKEDLTEMKQDLKDTKNYALTNKDNITKLTTWATGLEP